jgi:hypothetical protein
VFITFVRHPVMRVISEYKHVMAKYLDCAWEYQVSEDAGPGMSEGGFANFLTNKQNSIGARNRQAHFIAGVSRVLDDEQLLREAIDHLDQFAFVGVCDDLFQHSLDSLAFLIAANSSNQPVLDFNDGLRIFAITREIYSATVAANQVDLQLYFHAKRKLIAQLESLRECSEFPLSDKEIDAFRQPLFEWDSE